MKKTLRILSVLLAGTMLLSTSALACTGVYVGKDVSDQGTYLLARSEDQGQSDYNKMFLVQPRVDNVPGRFIEDTATGFKIPLPDTTWQYTYVPDYTRGDDGMYPGSCTNEHGVSITGTVSTSTCEKWEEADPFIEPGLREAILPAAVAAVATSARNAVDVLLGYVDEYGSEEGNTVMICDQNEAWFVEIYSGHHYCAMKMPDDQVAVFGNHNMIGLVDPKATPEDGYIYSEGLFELIDELDLAVKDGELYHLAKSVTGNTREPYNNMRNWGGMKLLAPSLAGDTYDNDNFYPLFYAPDEKVSVLDVMDIYRYRYEGTPIDVNLEGQEGNRVISTTNSSQIHILQTFSDWPAQCSAINWIALLLRHHRHRRGLQGGRGHLQSPGRLLDVQAAVHPGPAGPRPVRQRRAGLLEAAGGPDVPADAGRRPHHAGQVRREPRGRGRLRHRSGHSDVRVGDEALLQPL